MSRHPQAVVLVGDNIIYNGREGHVLDISDQKLLIQLSKLDHESYQPKSFWTSLNTLTVSTTDDQSTM